ncbi:TraY domain-containing protein [Klebsiella pneumoniae]|uniref:type II toxin-antitoxin system RelB family antitoxin n=1 Tax=Klebsiella pneumoniae TaxID=573 RepID=UPI0022B60FC2|nr:TraY domain-containing protein [Klebsiella pneumoniae]
MLAIRLSDEIESRLDSLAKQTGRTKTFYAREAILAHLEDRGLLSFSRNCCTRSPW